MYKEKPTIEMMTQYFQTLPYNGIAFVFAGDDLGVSLAISTAVHRGLQIKGLVVVQDNLRLYSGELYRVQIADLAQIPFDFILVGHPDREAEFLAALSKAGVPDSKIISAYSNPDFSSWVCARETIARHRGVSYEFEDLIAYRSDGMFLEIAEQCSPYTVTSLERMYALYKSVEYVVSNDIGGAFVECGVWNGGSAMVAALTFKMLGVRDRDIFLFDTFAGMTKPDDNDTDLYGGGSKAQWETDLRDDHNEWCYGSLDTVKANMAGTQYPKERIHYVVGDVIDTLPCQQPDKISILRLDTDWYESTSHELQCLFPKVVKNGILIIDDYGHWLGAKKAVDEYFNANKQPLFFNRIDYTGRLAVKTF